MSHYQLDPEEPENLLRPPGCQRFIKAFQELGKECGVGLRLIWAPEVMKFLWGKPRQRYANWKRRRHVGWFIGSVDEATGQFRMRERRKWDAFQLSPEADHRLPNGQWLVADWKEWTVAQPRWVIEERLDERKERPAHEAARYEWDPDTLQLIDALGPYPEEGKWACIQVISAHAFVCCKNATANEQLCIWGVGGRDPVDSDIEEVRQRIQARDENAKLRKDGMPTESEWKTEYQQIMDELKEGGERAKENYYEILKDAIVPGLNVVMKERVDLGSRHDESRRLVLSGPEVRDQQSEVPLIVEK
jgi:hypothetical protein